MTCETCLDLISARLDGPLTQQEAAELNAHLQSCPACRAIAEDLENLHSAMTQLGEAEPPADLSSSVMKQIKAERAADRRRKIRRLSALAACLVLCVGIVRVADATYSEYTRNTAGSDRYSYTASPKLALADEEAFDLAPAAAEPQIARDDVQSITEESNFKSLPFSIDAYPLPQTVVQLAPTAQLLDSAAGLEQLLSRFPDSDLSQAASTYDTDFFLRSRLLAVVLQESRSSITHTVAELTETHITILRDTSVPGDDDQPRWLLLIPTDLSGPARSLTVELISE